MASQGVAATSRLAEMQVSQVFKCLSHILITFIIKLFKRFALYICTYICFNILDGIWAKLSVLFKLIDKV